MSLSRKARIVKALAHPSRLLILDVLLVNGERCVCELAELVGADVSTVSRHLTVLRVAGIVADEKRGQQVFYRLRRPEVEALVRATEDMAAAITRDQASQLIEAC